MECNRVVNYRVVPKTFMGEQLCKTYIEISCISGRSAVGPSCSFGSAVNNLPLLQGFLS